MKNNEFNFVKVSNEGKNPDYEYGKAQNVEFSFQPENKNSVKDELNDNSVVNDKVEDNLLNSTKEQEKKKQETEQVESSSSSTPSASSASSGASAASSGAASGAAASSSIGATVATVAVAAVVAVGGAAGISVLHEEVAKEELIVFTSSEITSNSVDFSFRMSSNLLLPNENNEEDVEVESEKTVVYLIENSDGFKAEDYLVEYVEVDENTFEYTASIKDLLPNTSYALTLYVKEESPSFEQPNYLELATRSFTTKPSEEEPAVILLNHIEVSNPKTEFKVGDEFVFGGTVVAYYSDSSSKEVTDVNFSGYDLSKGGKQTVFVSYSEGDISQSTSYEIVVSKPDISFSTIDAGYNNVHFEVLIDKEAAEYDPTRTAPIQFCLSGPDGFYDQCWAEEVIEYDEDDLFAQGDFSGLEKDTEYTLTVKVSLEQELKTLGETTVKTKSSGFNFQLVRPEDGGVTFTISVLKDYIGYVEGETSPEVIACVSSEGEIIADAQVQISSYDSKYAVGTGFVADLPNGKTLNLEIHYYKTSSSDGEILGSKEFTTGGVLQFEFADSTLFDIGDDHLDLPFYIDAAEVERSATSDDTNIVMIIDGGLGYSEQYVIPYSSFEDQGDGRLFARYSFTNLDSHIEYTISVRNNSTETIYGSKNVSTTGEDSGFGIQDATVGATNVTFVFYLDTAYVPTGSTVTGVVATPSGQIAGRGTCQEVSQEASTGKTQYSVTINNLTASTNYIFGIYVMKDGTDKLAGTYNFTTAENPTGFSFKEIETTSGSARVNFTVKRDYIEYDTDPETAKENLVASFSSQSSQDPTEVSCNELTISSTDSQYCDGYFELTGVEPETLFACTVTYKGEVLDTNEFSTNPITFQFKEVNFTHDISFANHEIELSLDYEDDSYYPVFENLTIQFYDGDYDDDNKGYLGSPISLQSTTANQSITIPMSSDTAYEFDIDQIKSFDILNMQEVISDVGGNVTFNNIDSYPEVNLSQNSFIGMTNATDGVFVLPIQLEYDDPGKRCKDGFILSINDTYTASLDYTTDYQYAVFNNFQLDESETYDITIAPANDTSEIIGRAPQTQISEASTNIVYSAKLSSDLELSSADCSVNFILVDVYGDSQSNFKIVFECDSTRYIFDLYVNKASAQLEYTLNLIDGQSFTTYDEIKQIFDGGQTFNVKIEDTSSQLTIIEGASFTFLD